MDLLKQFQKYFYYRTGSIEELEENEGWRWKYDEKEDN